MKRKIGIMGGTFNPIHYGHLMIAQTAYEAYELDQILVMPCRNPYHKQVSNAISDQDRMYMVELAIADNPAMALSTLEFDRDGATYTVDTLRILHEMEPDTDYYFIMGADSLYHLESWKNVADILAMCTILVSSRDNVSSSSISSQIDYLQEKYEQSSFYYLNSPSFELSSHDIRKRVLQGRSIKYMLPLQVESYIQQRNLYRSTERISNEQQ